MSEKRFITHVQKVTPETAELYGQAATELGSFAVNVIAGPGETYIGNNKKPHTVAEGQRAVRVSGTVGPEGAEPFYTKVDEIKAQQTQQEIDALEQAVQAARAVDPNIQDNQ